MNHHRIIFLRPLAGVVASFLLCLSTAAQGRLWIVNQSAGFGDFVVIQNAIDAASDGDTVYVQSYTGSPDVTVDAKALTLLGEDLGLGGPVIGDVRIQNLATTQAVTMQSFRLDPSLGPNQIVLFANQGPIQLEEITLLNPGFYFAFVPTVTVDDCVSVAMTRCEAAGGFAPGVLITGSSVHMFETNVIPGAFGGTSPFAPAGVDITNGELLLSACSVQGAAGAGMDPIGYPGGPGVQIGSLATLVFDVGSVILGGPGGPGFGGDGPPGPPVSGNTSQFSTLPGTARTFDAQSPVTGGNPSQLSFQGDPGDVVIGAASLNFGTALLPTLFGTLTVSPPLSLLPLGTVDSSGALSTSVQTGPLPAMVSYTFSLQTAAIATDGSLRLSSPAALIVLP